MKEAMMMVEGWRRRMASMDTKRRAGRPTDNTGAAEPITTEGDGARVLEV